MIDRQTAHTVLATCGDPCGVGPELTLRALVTDSLRTIAQFVLVGPESIWLRATRINNCAPFWETIAEPDLDAAVNQPVAGRVLLLTIDNPANATDADVPVGRGSELSGMIAFGALKAAADYLVSRVLSGDSQPPALMTAPLSKHTVSLSQPGFVGHTGYLGQRFGTPPLMMLEGGGLRCALATDHIPMRDLTARIQRPLVRDSIVRITAAMTDDYGILQPRIGVAGLNPHAGEDGLLGDEEINIIGPAIADARARGIDATGPFPGDTLAVEMLNGRFDALLYMYHDQGLAPLKAVGFNEGVNVTLGLPIVRVSPDHGTAFGLAGGKGAAAEPTIAAFRRALSIAAQRRKRTPSTQK